MAGYLNAPEETADRFRSSDAGERELWTHDLFRQDRDGFLYFVARSNSIIKSLGHRIGPSEVEGIIMAVPWVVEAAVIGVPDPLRGEAITAYVVTTGTANIKELQSHCRSHLLPAACPVRFLVQERPLLRTQNGKIDRESLRAAACQINTLES
jgi:acyl-coenzyme A synthetase/AMP-(fatty) acid ligase